MGKNERQAHRQLWSRTQRNISAGTDHLAKQRSQQHLDAETHIHIHYTPKTDLVDQMLENAKSAALTWR